MQDFIGMFEKVAASYSVKGIPADYLKLTGGPGPFTSFSKRKPNLSRDLPAMQQANHRNAREMFARLKAEHKANPIPEPPSWIKHQGW